MSQTRTRRDLPIAIHRWREGGFGLFAKAMGHGPLIIAFDGTPAAQHAIRDAAALLGPDGEEYREWARLLEESGGDPPRKAADLVLRLISEEAGSVNGRFVWIDDPIQPPIPSWD